MKIPESEIRYSRLSLVDMGRVFWWKNRLFRAFSEDAAPAIHNLFDCGLVAKLVSEGLLVNSWPTDYAAEGYNLVLEHEVIPVPTYPREWSFSMLQDAADLVLKLNDIARTFGYQTKDCNGYNVLFKKGKPVFVDLASFVTVSRNVDVLFSYEEFLCSYLYPLLIWRSAGQYLGSRVAPRAFGVLLTPEAYFRYRWPFFRLLPDTWLIEGFKTLNSVRTLRHNDLEKLQGRHWPLTIKLLSVLRFIGLFRGPARIDVLLRKIRKLNNSTGASLWANYHDEFSRGEALLGTNRFDTVVAKIRSMDIRSVLEFAGNQGVLSRLLKRASSGMRVVCTDPDGAATDKGYRAARDANEGIEWAIFNPFTYEASPLETAPMERFTVDAVVVLALTHHLTLSQKLRLDHVFELLAQYTSKYVFVEFMPLGLHDGETAPKIPDWYNESWFRDEFCQRFVLIERLQLEPNRILYVGSATALAAV
jgi:hypothetical protein